MDGKGDGRANLPTRVLGGRKKVVTQLMYMAQSDAQAVSAFVENAPGMPKLMRQWDRYGRAMNVMTEGGGEAPSGSDLMTQGVVYVVIKVKYNRSHSFHVGGGA